MWKINIKVNLGENEILSSTQSQSVSQKAFLSLELCRLILICIQKCKKNEQNKLLKKIGWGTYMILCLHLLQSYHNQDSVGLV